MKGIVLRDGASGEADEVITSRAKSSGLKVVVSNEYEIPYEKTLFVEAGTRVPFDLLPAAWYFLDRWDAAVPLWRYGVTAADVGKPEERKLTEMIVRDLRVLLHSTELLFVRRNGAGQSLMKAWQEECVKGEDRRLAFLRALYVIKPRLCALPTTWLIEARQFRGQSGWSRHQLRGSVRSPNAGKALVTVELSPGRFVKVHAGDEEKVLAQFARQRGGR